MVRVVVIILVVIVGLAVLSDLLKRTSRKSELPPSTKPRATPSKIADAELPTETGRHRAQKIVQQLKSGETSTADSAIGRKEESDEDEESLPDPFSDNENK